MNRSETAALLAHCSAFDNRIESEAATDAWFAAFPPWVTYADACRVVSGYYARTGERISVADIIAGVRVIRAGRLVHLDALEPPEVDPDDVPRYLAARRRQVRALADGYPPPERPQIQSRHRGTGPGNRPQSHGDGRTAGPGTHVYPRHARGLTGPCGGDR